MSMMDIVCLAKRINMIISSDLVAEFKCYGDPKEKTWFLLNFLLRQRDPKVINMYLNTHTHAHVHAQTHIFSSSKM